jgi:hypothetical protein
MEGKTQTGLLPYLQWLFYFSAPANKFGSHVRINCGDPELGGLKGNKCRHFVPLFSFPLHFNKQAHCVRVNKKCPFRGTYFLSWRRPDSNRCPNISSESFLHAYFLINCRHEAGREQTNPILSWIFLGNRHSLRLQHLVLF